MFSRFSVAIFLLLLLTPLAQLKAETDVEFVIDISGSMKQKLGGATQMESARKALRAALAEIPKGQLVAVRVYGHRIEQTNKTESCTDSELLIPFQEVNIDHFDKKLSELTPRGYTPIAYSLQETKNDLLDVGISREAERVIILLTDGEETCGGDPIAVLKKLKEEGFTLKVYAVGFNVNDVARKQLQAIAEYSNGKYFDAKDALQLNQALQQATQQSAIIPKSKKTYGDAVRGGDSYETAVPLEFNREYKLDHHQATNHFDYFAVEAKKGSEIRVSIHTTDKGISRIERGTPEEDINPYAGVQIHGSERNSLKTADIIGDTFAQAEATYAPSESGRYFILIGSTYGSIHKDYFTFKLSLESKGDLDGDADAGDSFETALPIEPKRYEKNFLAPTDSVDIFSLPAKKGERYVFGVIPRQTGTTYFQLRVLDEFKQSLFNTSGKSGEGVRTESILIPEDGTLFLEVTLYGQEPTDYALVVRKEAPAPAQSVEESAPQPSAP